MPNSEEYVFAVLQDEMVQIATSCGAIMVLENLPLDVGEYMQRVATVVEVVGQE